MAWIIGIDEAGYGPNLGPFVMTAVACCVPDDHADSDLWHLLHPAVRRCDDRDDGRLLIADSKVVYSSNRGLAGLERGVLAALRPFIDHQQRTLADLIDHAAAQDHAELRAEAWYRGMMALPSCVPANDLTMDVERLDGACGAAGIAAWRMASVLVCPARFNALTAAAGTKGAVLANALGRLLRDSHRALPAGEPASVVVDKHGGRNTYAAFIQDALAEGAVVARQESMARSAYEVLGLGRELRLTFQPRAEAACLCVALASMASKYLRELLMQEFNHFWQQQVPGLKPTAGYPGDAVRFWEAIQSAVRNLGIAEDAVWRRK
jgi:ribonuclease HII